MKRIGKFVNTIKAHPGKKNITKALSISALNQVVSSGGNFVLSLYLVRELSPIEFGLYGVGFAISLFYAGIGNAMFLTQMVVNVPDKPLAQQIDYVASMGTADAVFCVLTFLVVLLALPMSGGLAPWLEQYVEFGIVVAAASVAYHFKELFTRYAYTARKEIWALKVNLAVVVTLCCLLTVQHLGNIQVTAVGALWLYASAQMMGVVVGQVLAKLPFSTVRIGQVWSDVREAWEGARWAVPTNIIYTLRGQAHTIVAAALTGPLGVAYLNATRLLITPAVFILPPLSQVALPRFATVRTQNKNRLLQLGLLFTIVVLMASFLYSGVLLYFLTPITQLVLGDKYAPNMQLAVAWCVFICIHVICINGTMVAQVLKKFRAIMIVSVATVLVMLCAIYVFYKVLGMPGIIYGMAAGDVFLSAIVWRMVAKECSR